MRKKERAMKSKKKMKKKRSKCKCVRIREAYSNIFSLNFDYLLAAQVMFGCLYLD